MFTSKNIPIYVTVVATQHNNLNNMILNHSYRCHTLIAVNAGDYIIYAKVVTIMIKMKLRNIIDVFTYHSPHMKS